MTACPLSPETHPANRFFFVSQAHRFVLTAFVTGSRILGRSFMAAYKQAQAASAFQRAQAKSGGGASAGASLSGGMTLDEACKVLNVKPPAGGHANVEEVLERYKRLFDANEPQKGGSFYLQSKIVRAKERFERELGPMKEKIEQEAEAKEGWKPKVYKDR
ncbi:hypothetical protein NHJ13051_008064 [Beauveria bassiana]|uniref:Mitochondrial import inner membrane translocase subunit TIM16 n=1 Tax=Beauveria bassiana TaxID=176275 RepID=A0A2N6NIQ7_BEABA|nr:Mitochondrial import inner membrane translocase subunit TIM16 [Beauveria bassiana]